MLCCMIVLSSGASCSVGAPYSPCCSLLERPVRAVTYSGMQVQFFYNNDVLCMTSNAENTVSAQEDQVS